MSTTTETTKTGMWYSFHCTAAATVTAAIDGETINVCTLDDSGSTIFCAPDKSITITTDGKYRVLPTKAPIGATDGGTSAALQNHVGALADTSSAGHVLLATGLDDSRTAAVPTAAQVQTALAEINGAQYNLLSDGDTKNSGEWQGLHIPYSLMPPWQITQIRIREMLNSQSTPLWLAAYNVNQYGTNTLLAVSAAAVSWEAGDEACWDFPGGLQISEGNNLSLLLIIDPTNAGETSCNVYSGHVKSYCAPYGVCQERYANIWYGNRTPELTMVCLGHVGALADTSSAGHVLLATGLDDSRTAAVPTAAQVQSALAEIIARISALES